MSINWAYPAPRTGLVGYWDKLIGPGATTAEILVSLIPALIAAVGVPLYAFTIGQSWTTTHYLVVAFIAFDLVGGVITNATNSAKRWYHRPGQGVRHHFVFVAIHIVHIVLMAWLFRGMDWLFVGVVSGALLLATLVVLNVPLYLRRPIAMLCTSGAVFLSLYGLPPTPVVEWFIPMLFLKLVVSHLLYEPPFQSHAPHRV